MSWHEALEVQMDLHKFHLSPLGKRYTKGFFESMTDTAIAGGATTPRDVMQNLYWGIADDMPEMLWRADCLSVTPDMQQIVAAAAESLPEEYEPDPRDLLSPSAFIWLEDPLLVRGKQGETMAMTAILYKLVQHEDSWWIHLIYFADKDNPYDSLASVPRALDHLPRYHMCHYFPVPHLTTTEARWYDAFNRPGAEEIVGVKDTHRAIKFFFALQLVAQQKMASRERPTPPRATRKRAKKWDPVSDRYISLITLRRKKASHNDEPKPIDWSHRWVVSGHWRNQWYPSLGRHQWTYIHEYIKGPEDKPLVVRERRVFDFRR